MTRLSDIVETFELLGDWDTRYQYLVELVWDPPWTRDPLDDFTRLELGLL